MWSSFNLWKLQKANVRPKVQSNQWYTKTTNGWYWSRMWLYGSCQDIVFLREHLPLNWYQLYGRSLGRKLSCMQLYGCRTSIKLWSSCRHRHRHQGAVRCVFRLVTKDATSVCHWQRVFDRSIEVTSRKVLGPDRTANSRHSQWRMHATVGCRTRFGDAVLCICIYVYYIYSYIHIDMLDTQLRTDNPRRH